MEISKRVDDISIKLMFQETDMRRFCFLVFSSHEEHIEIPIDCVETVVKEINSFEVVRLDDHLKSEDSQYQELTQLLNTCLFGVVILDGFKPNVIFEYGILKGLGKPCIVLLEKDAEVDVINYFPPDTKTDLANPKIDMDKQFSDVKDRYYVKYDKNNPKEIRDTIMTEYSKRKKDIENEFIRMILPHQHIIKQELREHFVKLKGIYEKIASNQAKPGQESEVIMIMNKVDDLINTYQLVLPSPYYYVLALTLNRLGKHEESLKLADSYLNAIDKDIDLMVVKVDSLLGMGRVDEGLETINEGLKIKPEVERFWHNKGLILEGMRRKDEALLCYKTGIKYNHGCSRIHHLYGLLLYEKNKYEEALEQFDSALAIDRLDKYLVWKARTLMKLEREDEAKNITEEALSYNENNPDAWYTLGNLAKDDWEAIGYYDKALSIESEHCGPICSKGAKLSNVGKHDEGLKLFYEMREKCLESETCETLSANIAKTLYKKGEADQALKHIDVALELSKDNPDYLAAKGQILVKLEKPDEALELLNKGIEIDPTAAGIWYDKSCALAVLKRIDESIESLKKAIELDPSKRQNIAGDRDFDEIRNDERFIKEFG